MISSLRELVRSLNNRVMLTVARAVVALVHDDKKIQALQLDLLKREIRDDVERFQEYGFTSKPFPGAEAVVVFVGGNRDLGLCIAVDDRRYRVKALADGEVCIYTDEGDRIHFKRDRVIEVTTETFRVNAGTKVEINTPLFELNASDEAKITTGVLTVDAPDSNFSGNITADGDIKDQAQGTGRTMASMRGVYNAHHQPVSGGVAQPPTEQM